MNILQRIVAHKKEELRQRSRLFPVEYWRESPLFGRNTLSLAERLTSPGSGGIIAEFKRRSPSRPLINTSSTVQQVVRGYEQAGAAGISVLTDTHFFGGCLEDLVQARSHCDIPVLRKDFTIDPYQIYEAKAFGADVVLLIAAVLQPRESESLANLAMELGLEVLLEVHDRRELLEHIGSPARLIGVNNRNLKTFEVRLETSLELIEEIPDTAVPVSESGLKSADEIFRLRSAGYRGFLMGEQFMKAEDPGMEAAQLINTLLRESKRIT